MSDDINSENMKSENERILFPQEPIPEEHFHVISPVSYTHLTLPTT